jgi:hypothetical protein
MLAPLSHLKAEWLGFDYKPIYCAGFTGLIVEVFDWLFTNERSKTQPPIEKKLQSNL